MFSIIVGSAMVLGVLGIHHLYRRFINPGSPATPSYGDADAGYDYTQSTQSTQTITENSCDDASSDSDSCDGGGDSDSDGGGGGGDD